MLIPNLHVDQPYSDFSERQATHTPTAATPKMTAGPIFQHSEHSGTPGSRRRAA